MPPRIARPTASQGRNTRPVASHALPATRPAGFVAPPGHTRPAGGPGDSAPMRLLHVPTSGVYVRALDTTLAPDAGSSTVTWAASVGPQHLEWGDPYVDGRRTVDINVPDGGGTYDLATLTLTPTNPPSRTASSPVSGRPHITILHVPTSGVYVEEIDQTITATSGDTIRGTLPSAGEYHLSWGDEYAGGRRSLVVTVPAGDSTLDLATGVLTIATPAPSVSTRTLHVDNMVEWATVRIGDVNLDVATGVWDAEPNPRRGWSIAVPASVPAGSQTVRITTPMGNVREAPFTFTTTGTTRADFNTMPTTSTGVTIGLPLGFGLPPAPSKASLRITGVNPHARVLLDGAEVTGAYTDDHDGTLAFGVDPGRHTVRVEPPTGSGDPARQEIVVVPAEGVAFAFGDMTAVAGTGAPPPAPAELAIGAIPPGSSIYLDGSPENVTPRGHAVAGRPAFTWAVPLAGLSGNVAVRVVAPTGETRTMTVPVPASGLREIRYGDMTVEVPTVSIAHIPPGSAVYLGADTTNLTADPRSHWNTTDPANPLWVVPATAGPTTLRVVPPAGQGPARRVTGPVPASGNVTVDFARMESETPEREAPPPSPPEETRGGTGNVIVRVDPSRFVSVTAAVIRPGAGRTATDMTASSDSRTYSVTVPAGDYTVEVIAVPMGGPPAHRYVESVHVVAGSTMTANLADLTDAGPVIASPTDGNGRVNLTVPATDITGTATRTGRVVVRGAPAGISPARVVAQGGVAYDPAQSAPLMLDAAGNLAATWPVGPARLQVGTFDEPVTVILNIDATYDYTPTGLVFQPMVTSETPGTRTGEGIGVTTLNRALGFLAQRVASKLVTAPLSPHPALAPEALASPVREFDKVAVTPEVDAQLRAQGREARAAWNGTTMIVVAVTPAELLRLVSNAILTR